MNYEELLELAKNRRSIRRFKPDPIPDEYIDKIIEVARWAPSGFNQQPWEFVVIKKPELRSQIVGYCKEQLLLGHKMNAVGDPNRMAADSIQRLAPGEGKFEVAPVLILLLGDHRTSEGLPSAAKYGTDYLHTTFNASLTCSFLYMHLAATTLGLAAQWLSSSQTPYVNFMIKELLGIPRYLSIYNMLALGYPAAQPNPRLVRPREEMVHNDYCGSENFRSDAAVAEYIRKTRL
jgi:nitroreductase